MDKYNLVSKKDVRSYIKEKKKQLTNAQINDKSQIIVNKIMDMREYKTNDSIFTYVNFNEEVVTTELIIKSLKLNKNVYVPKVFKVNSMGFIKIESLTDLNPGYYGVLEPDGELENATDKRKGLFIMPGLAFDRKFHRIGYGGGFYDRYLEASHEFTTVAVGFDFQLFDDIPYEEHDLSPQYIITDKEMIADNKDGGY